MQDYKIVLYRYKEHIQCLADVVDLLCINPFLARNKISYRLIIYITYIDKLPLLLQT